MLIFTPVCNHKEHDRVKRAIGQSRCSNYRCPAWLLPPTISPFYGPVPSLRHKSLRFRIFIVACTLFLPYCLHLPARILKGKKRCGPLKLFLLPHFLTLQCQNEVLRCCASFVPEREKMCVLLHLVSFHSTIIYSFFLFALGDWRRRNFRISEFTTNKKINRREN